MIGETAEVIRALYVGLNVVNSVVAVETSNVDLFVSSRGSDSRLPVENLHRNPAFWGDTVNQGSFTSPWKERLRKCLSIMDLSVPFHVEKEP